MATIDRLGLDRSAYEFQMLYGVDEELRRILGFLAGGAIGLWLGHRNEPGLRPVLKDLQLMMIGPAWLLSVLYRRLGIPF